MKFSNLMNFLKPYFWRLFFTIMGLFAAISFLILGFWKTVVILLCCGIGYLIGVFHDKEVPFLKLLGYWWSRRG